MARRKRTADDLRSYAKVIERYLKHLNENDHTNAWRAPEWYVKRIEALQAKLDEGNLSYVARIKVVQQLREAQAGLEEVEDETADPTPMFVKVAAAWGEEHGIDYFTWRDLGVPAKVLKEAGITRAG